MENVAFMTGAHADRCERDCMWLGLNASTFHVNLQPDQVHEAHEWFTSLYGLHRDGRCGEEFIIHENVEDFPPSLLEDLLGDLYELSGTSVFCCSIQGVAYERKRRWTFLVLRNSPTMAAIAAGQKLLPSWPNFKDLFARECSWTWESYFWCGKEDLEVKLL